MTKPSSSGLPATGLPATGLPATGLPATGLTVVDPGLLSLLIDSGRNAVQRFGFCESGPMDHDAYWWANWLVGNASDACALEIMGDAEFRLDVHAQVAVTGPAASLAVNQQQQADWTTVSVSPGDSLQVRAGKPGQRAYLAIAARWAVRSVIGSVCTVAREHLGGLDGIGSALRAGDTIPLAEVSPRLVRTLNPEYRPNYDLSAPLGVVLGYQHHAFSATAKSFFFNSDYRVSSKINRMGYRLSGTAVACSNRSLRSEGINLGAIQVPPDGQPIIMMRDRQTLGGYPKLGCVVLSDINRLAQAVPGDEVTFKAIDMNDARAAYLLKLQKRARLTRGTV
ncbi:biotin-dependent carboxyltransferase family protein [Alteromonas sp. CYL-A6]|uniref:5-oxoprolinase subunit C family protein n=1 Tax=Alteromonas nitratireducens TaxID=3390813 RepID=UPI0034C4C372